MFVERGRRWAGLAAALVTGGALVLAVAGPAAAEPTVKGVARAVPGTSVTLKLDGRAQKTSALALELKDGTVPVFCIDFHTPVARDGEYAEGTWSQSEVKNLGRVQWVLTHGYPNADRAKLLAAAGATLPAGLSDTRRDTLLYFGTQTAVWHFSDGVALGEWTRGLTAAAEYDVIRRVHDYLVRNATDQPEPKAELSLDPASATATTGGRAGPFTVHGPSGEIALKVDGGTAVDADGRTVGTTTNGGRFWLTATAAGRVTVTVSAPDSVSFGRVFLFSGGKNAKQKLILGGSTGTSVTAAAAASFAAAPASPSPSATPSGSPSPSPSPSASVESPSPSAPAESSSPASPAPSTSPASNGGGLPLTGSPIAMAALAGLALLAFGAVAVLLVRRRKVRFTV
ncbi:thioester domain-containing protein [Micromonospora rifamycinica]|uniref:LPXTG-motif cell wall anchor domain-containing protein/TQXA domain-containing protein n=1 Tax=Micromonospora rifamycinica TaxID=291594 RepID=A0A125Q1B6_9ACTN|nr:thioester domain-containing protein [Micromonospora rifamycinica]KWV31642.1 cell wall anchor protein [Micromonospora rifamycinica]SCG79247.1 LPXTG-motif cell wall anchor domain-containing protein/TQXA domain-containing protein [Micromonospora rifamycinica]